MSPEVLLFSAFMAGVFGSLHCVGMCGGISSALGLSIGTEKKGLLSLTYQLGRIVSYAIAGTLVAYLGTQLSQAGEFKPVAMTFKIISVVFMASLGLYLAGWFPKFAQIERIGLPLWKRIAPLGKRFMPVKSIHQAFVIGMLWGWIPCGLVYSILLWSVTAPSAEWGALIMVAFGLGTLPAMFAFALGGSQVMAVMSQPALRKVMGVLIILIALYGLVGHM
jgi:sulfite exporter TauE/SafE